MWNKRDGFTSIKEVFLRNIGAKSLDDINGWFKKSYANGYEIKQLKEAVKFVMGFKDKKVTIVGDYDADGVTSTSILLLALKKCGFKNVTYRIPKRFSEGFGINPVIIDEITEGLVITCDNGVAQIEAIEKALKKGLSVVIIDHHLPVEKGVLPNADYVIDPNAVENSADFKGYCGAGLCLRFARELGIQNGMPNLHKMFEGLAAIGTVADVMELRQENYVIVRNGLKALLNPSLNTLGTYTLCSATCGKSITAHDIGFKIGPCINAASRLIDDGASIAVNLLTTTEDYNSAVRQTEKLIGLNDVRKGKKREANALAEKIISDECMFSDVPLILYLPKTAEGIIGITAGYLCEKYRVPAIVLTDTDDENVLKGSARSCGNCDIKAELDKVNNASDCLFRYGGHEGAAGLSVFKDKLALFREILSSNLADGFINEENKKDEYDIEINASDIAATIEELKKYEPFGEGNAPIIFKVKDFDVLPKFGKYVAFMGDGTIAKLSGSSADAIGFDMKTRFDGFEATSLNLLGTLAENSFNGKTTFQVEFSDFEFNSRKEVVTPLASALRTMAFTS